MAVGGILVSMHIVAIVMHILGTGPRHVELVQGLLIIISKLRLRTLEVHLHLRRRGGGGGGGGQVQVSAGSDLAR